MVLLPPRPGGVSVATEDFMKLLIVATLLLAFGSVTCAIHPMATCYNTGQVKLIGNKNWVAYKCSCGDVVWVQP